MSKAERIVWECETVDRISNEHPEWDSEQVQRYFGKVVSALERQGFFQ